MKVMNLFAKVLKMDLARLWGIAQPDEMFLGVFSKISFTLLENAINNKSKHMRQNIFNVLRIVVSRYHQTTEAVNLLSSLIRKAETFVTHMVDLTDTIVSDAVVYDDDGDEEETEDQKEGADKPRGAGASFLGDVLVDISHLSYRELATNNNAAKGFASYVTSMAERFPKQVLQYVPQLMAHLSGESANMRSGIIEALGYVIHKAFAMAADSGAAEEIERIRSSFRLRDELLDVLLQRIRDKTSFTRGRVLQTWAYLAENKAITKSFWQQVTTEAVGRLQDKAAIVRKCAIQLLSNLLVFNPFGSDLKLTQFKAKFAEARQILDQRTENRTDEVITLMEKGDEATLSEMQLPVDTLKLANAYVMYRDGVSFIESMHNAMPDVSTLLGSKNVSDVQEAIRFFVRASDFYLENAKEGVRKMILLVATPQPEIKQAVIEAFVLLYMKPPSSLSEDLHALWVAKNLISWTLDASLGELTSLEDLLGTMMNQDRITDGVTQTLWDIFMQRGGKTQNDVTAQLQAAEGRGAIIVLSMLASTDPTIIRQHLSEIVQIGLGARAYVDPTLAKWSCIALQKLASAPAHQQSGLAPQPAAAEEPKKGRGKKAGAAPKRKKRKAADSDDDSDVEPDSDDDDKENVGKKSAAPKAEPSAGAVPEHARLESSHKLFKKLTDLIETDRIATSKWFGAAEQAMNAVYLLAETPDKLMSEVIKRMAAPLFPSMFKTYAKQVAGHEKDRKERLKRQAEGRTDDEDNMDVDGEESAAAPAGVDHQLTPVGQLARLLFVLGHSAMKQLVYIDTVVRHIKARNEAKEKKSAAAAAAAANRRGRKSMGGKDEEEQEAIEKELGVGTADPEDESGRKRAEDAVVWDSASHCRSDLTPPLTQSIV